MKRNIELTYIKKFLFRAGERYLFKHYPGLLNLSNNENSDAIISDIKHSDETEDDKIMKNLKTNENRD